MRIATVLGILALPAIAAMAPVREVTSEAAVGANQPLPGFYEGYAFFADRPSSNIRIYSPDGPLLFQGYVQYQTAPIVLGIAVDSNGTIAVSYVGKTGATGGVDLLDSKGNLIRSLATGYYVPSHVSFGVDHSIWLFGWQRTDDPRKNASEYMAVRHYSASGTQIGSYLPRSLFPKGLEPACQSWQERGIYTAADRIGVLACSGMISVNPEWVELDLDGNVTGRWHVGAAHRAVSMTQDAHVYAQDTANGSSQIYLLDRAAGAFQAVSWTIPGRLYGAVGDERVFWNWKAAGPMQFKWYAQP
jgi:hypothetical protein